MLLRITMRKIIKRK